MKKDDGEGDMREERIGKWVEGGGMEQEGGGREQEGAAREQEEKLTKVEEGRDCFLFKYFMRMRRRKWRRKRVDMRKEVIWKEEE